MLRFEGVYPISGEDLAALPVGEVARAIDFYTRVLGFEKIGGDEASAIFRREAAQVGVVLDLEHDPGLAGSCYFEVTDVDALRQELSAKGANPGEIHFQQHGGNDYRLFFVRECDSMDQHDGYCFCFGRRVGA
jgi:catechol 2,3-dioxygenase-like lactoylglutathione lyase family enzyme